MIDLQAAEARTRETREKLFATLGEVQQRLRPSALAQDAVEGMGQGVASAARKGAEAVRKRPAAVAAVAGAIGLVMARGWIFDIVGGRKGKRETGGAPDRSKAEPAKRATKGKAK